MSQSPRRTPRVVTFGEIMLRLCPPGHQRFVRASSFDVVYGGGEANVAVSLANYGLDADFVSKIPAHEIGQCAVNELRRFGVGTDHIVRGGDRLGIYFLEAGASQRASKVIYDRAGAAVTTLGAEELDPSDLFDGADWFHFTGITPALGEKPRETLRVLLEAAKEAGCTVSCDLNYRKNLWSVSAAQACMVPLMEWVDVCIANEEDAEKCLGMEAGETDVSNADLDIEAYGALASRLRDRFGFSAVAISLRESFSASRNGWSAMLLDDKDCSEATRSRRYDVQLVDRVGGGDSFAGGLIYGLLSMGSTRDALEFAVAASCLKQTIPGDLNLASVDEVTKLMSGGGSGRVER